MHFPERHERSTVVHFCPGVFTALMEGHDDFALRSARQESAAVVGRDCFGGIVALAANQFRSLHGTPALTEMDRSEEHTSELQSHVNLVCRLLLEKKKSQLPL